MSQQPTRQDLFTRLLLGLPPTQADRVVELWENLATVVPALDFPLSRASVMALQSEAWALELQGLTRKALGMTLAEFITEATEEHQHA